MKYSKTQSAKIAYQAPECTDITICTEVLCSSDGASGTIDAWVTDGDPINF